MSIFKRWSNWVEDIGINAGDFTQQLSTGMIQTVCNVTTKYPRLTGYNPFSRGLLKSYCAYTPNPPTFPPNPNFSGGQCPDIQYKCFGWYVNNNVDLAQCGQVITWQAGPIFGPIVGVNEPPGVPFNSAVLGNQALNWTPIESDLTGTLIAYDGRACGFENVTAPTAFNKESVIITHCVPFDGSEDICGDPPSNLPPDPPIDNSDFLINLPINIFNTNNEIIEIENVILDVEVDIGEITGVKINIDDVNFYFTPNGIETDAPSTPAPDPDEKIPFDPEDYKEEFSDNPEPQPGEEPPEQTEEEVEDETINWVLVNIVQTPVSGRAIIFPNPSDNTYFAGYFSWYVRTPSGAYRLEEIPIRKTRMAFKAPSQALGYRFYAVNGATLSARIYKQLIPSEN